MKHLPHSGCLGRYHYGARSIRCSRDDIKNLPAGEIHEFHHTILRRLDHLKESGKRGCYVEEFDPKTRGLGTWNMYYID